MKKIGIVVIGIALITALNVLGADMDARQTLLQKAKSELAAVLTALDQDLTNAAKKLAAIDRKSDEARKILAAVCKDRPYVYDCAIIDMDKKLSLIEPENVRKYEGADVSGEAAVKELFKTRSPLVSKVFKTSEGLYYIDFICPIINENGELAGAVSMLVRHDKLLEGVLVPLVNDQPYIWVMQTDGLCIYDRDPAQINKNILTDPMFQAFTALIAFARNVAKEPNGAGSYSFHKKDVEDKTIVKKDAVWDTVKMPANEWRIVAVKIEEQAPAQK